MNQTERTHWQLQYLESAISVRDYSSRLGLRRIEDPQFFGQRTTAGKFSQVVQRLSANKKSGTSLSRIGHAV